MKCNSCKYKQIENDKQVCYLSEDGKYFNVKQDTTIHRMKRRFGIEFPNKR